jgi:hypothetical protein
MEETEVKINEDFTKVICDFAEDLLITFPDIIDKTNNPIKELNNIIKNGSDGSDGSDMADITSIDNIIRNIYTYCKSIFPKHFFYILYENEDLFNKESEVFLLPNINFVDLWNSDISEETKSTIWNYLKLILFTVVADVKNKDTFGDSAQLFEAINNDEFKKKIAESLAEMENIFKKKTSQSGTSPEKDADDADDETTEDRDNMELPNAEELHAHINQMMEGKIGSLAKEIAEETAEELDINIADNSSINDVFSKLFKNPAKLLSLVKNVGSKLDTKLKSGEIKESELIKEATDFVANMKNMPGMNNLESLFSKMGIPGMGGKGGKMDMGALNRELSKNLNKAKMKEKMLNKLEKKRETTQTTQNTQSIEGTIKDLGINDFGMQELLYSLGEHVEKTKPETKPENKPENKRNKRNKKKKNKMVNMVNVVSEQVEQEE